jgi:hypothetical protein
VAWQIAVSDEFASWYAQLDDDEVESVNYSVALLDQAGPLLGRPHVDSIRQSRHFNMKELRVQHRGAPYRILFAFDPQRCAYLILGGDKTGNRRWYDKWVPIADSIFDQYLAEIAHRKQGD